MLQEPASAKLPPRARSTMKCPRHQTMNSQGAHVGIAVGGNAQNGLGMKSLLHVTWTCNGLTVLLA